jgi:hypothetical protein
MQLHVEHLGLPTAPGAVAVSRGLCIVNEEPYAGLAVDTSSRLLTASYFRRVRDLKGAQTVRTGDDEVAGAAVLYPERGVSELGGL